MLEIAKHLHPNLYYNLCRNSEGFILNIPNNRLSKCIRETEITGNTYNQCPDIRKSDKCSFKTSFKRTVWEPNRLVSFSPREFFCILYQGTAGRIISHKTSRL